MHERPLKKKTVGKENIDLCQERGRAKKHIMEKGKPGKKERREFRFLNK